MERMKLLSLSTFLLLFSTAAMAQHASATATQTIQLTLNPTIDIKFKNTAAATGSTVGLAFNTVDQYAEGVLSGAQELEVRSNKNYTISVKTDAPTFTYSGGETPVAMPVDNTLFMSVTNNTTGGALGAGFGSYNSLSYTSQDLILNGAQGDDKGLVIAYKAKPALGYPAGTYSVGVVYTATQP